MRKIKKYKNNKLYDYMDKCYINFEELLTLVKNGENISISNPKSIDITYTTLLALLREIELKKAQEDNQTKNITFFNRIIRNDGLMNYLKKLEN